MTNDLPGPSIPLLEAGLCGDCLVLFSLKDKACPKCGSEIGIVAVRVIGELIPKRERETLADPIASTRR